MTSNGIRRTSFLSPPILSKSWISTAFMVPGFARRLLTGLTTLFFFGLHTAVAEVSIPSGWTVRGHLICHDLPSEICLQDTSIALSRPERASVAQAALEVIVQTIDNSMGAASGASVITANRNTYNQTNRLAQAFPVYNLLHSSPLSRTTTIKRAGQCSSRPSLVRMPSLHP
jgi:hypothetical protein